MRPTFALLALALLLAAGCVTPGSGLDKANGAPARPDVPFGDLQAADATGKALDGGALQFTYKGVSGGAASAILVSKPVADPVLSKTFDVDARVGYAEANITFPQTDGSLTAIIRDQDNKIQCAALSFLGDTTCTVPVPSNLTAKAKWTFEVRSAYEQVPTPVPGQTVPVGPPGKPFTATLTLHPISHLTVGDPWAGVDKSISFRLSDTKARGGENNVGVLADGSVWTQSTLKTLKSTDDGTTWKDVAPPTTGQQTLDPMMFVDPVRNLVLVDQLYIACSVLAWSSDAGASWTSNPAACGGPGDDHQKIATGPNPTPAPFPAVYYSYSSFAQGIFVSRSLDGGVTFTTTPVVGLGDGKLYANDGPVLADTKGNVFVPLYMCDHGGYVGVGVSHDYGATFSFVKTSDAKEFCSDVDPGLAIDQAGAVYFAYHRPDGVYYQSSTDHGDKWSAPVRVSPSTQKSFVHVDAVAGDAGRLAIIWRGTSDTAKGPDAADGWANWQMYTAFVENASGPTPTTRVALVTPPDDPTQRGPLCTAGIACSTARNLVDFVDVAAGPDGRVYISYSDGCTKACPMPADSRDAESFVAIEDGGPLLFEHGAPWAKTKKAELLPPLS